MVMIQHLGWSERRLAQLTRQQAEDHTVPTASLEGHVGTKKTLTGKPATVGDML
jgi:hypothetical protein